MEPKGPWGRNKPVNPRHQLEGWEGEDGGWWTLTGVQQGLDQNSEGCRRDANSAKSGATEEVKVKGGTVSLNPSVTQGMAGGQEEVKQVLRERDVLF